MSSVNFCLDLFLFLPFGGILMAGFTAVMRVVLSLKNRLLPEWFVV